MAQGTPFWYELNTTDPDQAGAFYARVLDWQVINAGMPGFDYRLAQSGDVPVAGLAPTSDMPHWLICFAVDDCAATCRAMQADGAKLLAGPDEVPGTGYYTVLADPQGAYFGLLQPDLSAMTPEEIAESGSAFDPQTPGHGHWHELMSSDPAAGLAFYAKHFGWTKGAALDMGEMGLYQLFRHDGADIGGLMGLAGAPGSYWLPYFGVTNINAAATRIAEAGGKIQLAPREVPGGAWITIAQDPQGAWFAIIGPQMG